MGQAILERERPRESVVRPKPGQREHLDRDALPPGIRLGNP